ncbi:MAG: hypothetical protein ABFD89_28685 [Bryobacteraceae bacterium]
MHIDKGASVAVVLNRNWANLYGVRFFLRQNETPQREIRGVDESHIVFAEVLDADDSRGLWIELNTDRHREDPTVERFSFLVPWREVLTIVIAKEFSPAIREEARKIGFTAEAK